MKKVALFLSMIALFAAGCSKNEHKRVIIHQKEILIICKEKNSLNGLRQMDFETYNSFKEEIELLKQKYDITFASDGDRTEFYDGTRGTRNYFGRYTTAKR